MTSARFLLWSQLATLVVCPGAQASQPVEKAFEGCVRSGVFEIVDYGATYSIRVYREPIRPGGKLVQFPMTDYEGRRIRYDHGYLLPGDIYVVSSEPNVLGPCE